MLIRTKTKTVFSEIFPEGFFVNILYTVSVDFSDDGPEHPIVNPVSHDNENRSYHGGRNATLLVVIEAVEHLPQHYKDKTKTNK